MLITKSRDNLRDENQKLKEQNQQKTKSQQQEYLFEIFSNKYGFQGDDLDFLIFRKSYGS